MSESAEDEPKIIVDSDWKSQVQAEKEQLRQQEQASTASAEETSSDTADETTPEAQPDEAAEFPQGEIPPASFMMLVTTLATQAAAALGQLPDPVSGKPSVNKGLAKHLIDTLSVLEEKTKGNLSEDESQLLGATLHELRFAYVQTNQ